MLTFFVIFGAAVRADGSPSGTLSRRVEGAFQFSRKFTDIRFITTGGVGRYGPAEALIMRDLLIQKGISDDQIIIEDQATNTLQSIENCADILKKQPLENTIFVCSSPYHNPRCALLFRAFGIPAKIAAMPGDRAALGPFKWLYYIIREIIAVPWDLTTVFIQQTLNTPKKSIK